MTEISLAHRVLRAQHHHMGMYRDSLLRLIRLALESGKVGAGDLGSALPDPRALDAVEKAAWIELHFWSENANLRALDRRWERWSTDRLRHLLASLQMRYCDYQI